MDKIEAIRLKAELAQFTGTGQYYFNPVFADFRYTDGIKYLAERAGAYWLLEYIFSSQPHRSLRNQNFQVWKLMVNEDNSALIKVEDGNKIVLEKFKIPYTDFPLQEIDVWLIDKILILPSEY
jgi:hypothetical protein